MPGSLVVAALCLLVLGAALLGGAFRTVRGGRWLAGGLRGLVGTLCLVLAALAATITVGLQGYRALTYEEVAATVKTEPVGLQRFRATITLPDRRLAMYELDRVAGRYNAVADERTRPHTVFALAPSHAVDLFFLARRKLLGPLVDAEYGSAAFIAAARPATYEVRVSATGLLMRPVL